LAGEAAHELEAGVREGDVLAGKYRVERILGVGGMGVVVAAHHVDLDNRVAIKFLRPALLNNSEAVARFAREARAAVKITGEHVARVSDVGTLENGSPYMVIEYLEGVDLAAWLQDRGPLPAEQAVDFVLQACVAVAEAHALGIIHRDLKPANLFCIRRADGKLSIKVLDFGVSKLKDLVASGERMSMTKTSAMMGSPLYMSPEQMRSSKDVDAGTDIWALGIILCELITGSTAFPAESVTELAIKVTNEQPLSIRHFRPDAPAGLDAAVFKCLEKDRSRRYQNVAELALALLPFGSKQARASVDRITGIIQAAGLSSSALDMPPSRPPVALGREAATVTPGSVSPWSSTQGIGSGKKAVVVGIGILALALVVGIAVQQHRASSVVLATSGLPATVPAPSLRVPPPELATTAALQPAEPAPSSLPSSAASVPPTPAVNARPAPPSPLPPPARHDSPASAARAVPPAPPASVATSAPRPPKRDCDPPFTLDDQGQKQFKPECFLSPQK
jgi:eukaryotic-like serine/threonine-protein kinase